MKKLILALFIIAAITALNNKTFAQYAIPSYDVPVIADPTTFEETATQSTTSGFNLISANPASRGERKVNVRVIDNDMQTTASSTIEIYSLDESITYGPYTVYEETTFELLLTEEYEWGVRVLAASEGCEMSVWFD